MSNLSETIIKLPIRVLHKLRFEFRVMTGRGMLDRSPHRLPLEQSIIPYFVNDNMLEKVLFIGVSVTTIWYKKTFKTKEYWTIDIDPRKTRLGSKRHINDALRNLSKYFEEAYFDVIFMNGVIGWGLDNLEEADASIHACYHCLKSDGKLIIGWNDIPERRPFLIDDLKSLKHFSHWTFPPFKSWRFLIEKPTAYYYDFYLKSPEYRR